MIYFSKYTNKLRNAGCIYPYIFYARIKHSTPQEEGTGCVVGEMFPYAGIITCLTSRCSLYVVISSCNPLLQFNA